MKSAGILAGTLLLGAMPLLAEPVRFDFEGTLTMVEDRSFLLEKSVEVGKPFSGYYIFESSKVDSNTAPDVGDYWHDGGEATVVVKVDNYIFRNQRDASRKFLLEIVNRATDNYLLRSYANTCSLPLPVDHISWQLDDNSGSAFTTDTLPATPPEVEQFNQWFGLSISGGLRNQGYLIRGRVDSIRKVPVAPPVLPELTSEPAVELRWKTEMGYFYQLQSSSDLSKWTDIGAPVLGNGTHHSEFIPAPSGSKTVYRAVITNHDSSKGPSSLPIKNFVLRGKITSIDDRTSLLDDSVTIGSPIQAFYTFFPDQVDSNSPTDVGDYWHYERYYGVAAKVGDYVFASNPEHVRFLVEVVDRPQSNGGDHYLLRSYNNVCSRPILVEHISWQLDGTSESAVSGDRLPTEPPKLANFSQTFGFDIIGGCTADGRDREYHLRAVIESVTEQPLIIPNVPPVQIHRAEQLRWQSSLGVEYQLQSTDESGAWSDFGEPMIGNGGLMSSFISKRESRQQFRVVLAAPSVPSAPPSPHSAAVTSLTTETLTTRAGERKVAKERTVLKRSRKR